jgi:Cu/Ag efflux protein CusF
MAKWLCAVVTVLLMFSVVGAWAAEMEGKIQTVDTSDRTLVLDNGMRVTVADGVAIEGLREGNEVKVTFEERDGRNVATIVEVK